MGRKDAAPRRLGGLALSREKMGLNPSYKEIFLGPSVILSTNITASLREDSAMRKFRSPKVRIRRRKRPDRAALSRIRRYRRALRAFPRRRYGGILALPHGAFSEPKPLV